MSTRAGRSICALAASVTLAAVIAGCNLDSAPGSASGPVEGDGMSAATDPGDGEGGGDGSDARLSKAIINPAQTEAPTLPAAIITPSPASAPIDPPDEPAPVPTLPGPPVCGNMAREEGEVCDSSVDPCCEQDCSGLLRAGTTCRTATGVCDVTEVCDGESRACPPDRVASSEQTCRLKSDEPCDISERCTGETKDCPPDLPAPAGTVCGEPSMPCDAPELCDGVSRTCPLASVSVAPATQVCRAANGACDAEERCDGVTYDCPLDLAAPRGTECRAVRGVCDVAETCDGESRACPDDDFLFDESNPCRPTNPDAEPCGIQEYCNGTGPDCPPDLHRKDQLCRPANPATCDAPELCDGKSGACPDDAYLPSGSACNGGRGKCSFNLCCPGGTMAGPDQLCAMPEGGRVVFVTSASVSGNIGIAGADRLCNDLARSANLAGNFSAWLSNSTLRNGGAANRIGEGPYQRVDSVYVANDKASLISPNGGGVLNGISTTEWGDVRSTRVWTGTSALGTTMMDLSGLPLTCSDWSSNSADVGGEVGVSDTNKPDWTQGGADGCNTQLPLYCFPAPTVVTGAIAFVTKDPIAYLGDGFTGIANGDDTCNRAAQAANLKGTFVAWLSDGQTNAIDRIIDRAYFRLDGQRIAASKADLTDGTIDYAIEIDQFGNRVVPQEAAGYVWTGTKPNGLAGQHCAGWKSSDTLDATAGRLFLNDAGWTDAGTFTCLGGAHLYCFQATATSIDGPRID